MKKFFILAALAAMSEVVFAEFGTIGMSADVHDTVVGRDVSPALVRSVEVWSTETNASVTISRIRNVVSYTNCYDITYYEDTNLTKVVDSYYYSYSNTTTGVVLKNSDAAPGIAYSKELVFTEDGSGSTDVYPYYEIYYDMYTRPFSIKNVYYKSESSLYQQYGFSGDIALPTSIEFDYGGPSLVRVETEKEWHIVTNTVPHYITNRVWKAKCSSNTITNTMFSAESISGFESFSMTNDMFIVYGDTIHAEGMETTEGSATYATIIYEK